VYKRQGLGGELEWLHAYWCGLKKQPYALRSDIDPLDFPHLLPRMAIIERVEHHAGETFRYRLAGTEITQRTGRDPTGKTFHDLYSGAYLRQALSVYQDIIATGMPHRSTRRFAIDGLDGTLYYERLILPLSTGGDRIDQFLLMIGIISQDATPDRNGSF